MKIHIGCILKVSEVLTCRSLFTDVLSVVICELALQILDEHSHRSEVSAQTAGRMTLTLAVSHPPAGLPGLFLLAVAVF